jgi:fatty acid desaturase
MRFWLSESKRRPDPEPVVTDDRTAILTGLVLWVVALAVLLVFVAPLVEAGRVWWLWACLVGIGLGLGMLVYVHRRARQR